ncbi:MAG: GNAT family N-acetyltransferase, partial [Janthinobacterium lividum]
MNPHLSTRTATLSDLPALLPLFRNLDEISSEPPEDQAASNAWNRLLSMSGVRVIVAVSNHNPEILLATCTIVIIPNVTHSARPHALIENVSTLREERNKGYGRMVVEAA